MAPLPPNQTWRAWIDYSGPLTDHSLMLRITSTANVTDVENKAFQFAQLFDDVLANNYTINALRTSAPGSSFSNVVPIVPLPGLAGAVGAVDTPRFLSMVGRSQGGRRVRQFFYGVPVGLTPDYRVPINVSPTLNAVYNFIEDQANGLVAIDNLPAAYLGYFNQGLNAYYQRDLRPG